MVQINTDEKKIDKILNRGVHEVFIKEELKVKLMSGKQLHLKLGTDVTGPNLHLGHAVVHRKIRDFQELGHRVTLIIGDFTTLIGDHSDKVDMRAETTPKKIKENEEKYKEQFFMTVKKEQTKIRHNSEWLKKLNFNDVIELTKQFTIAQMLDRETFMLRYKENKPIGLDEFLYPLMQGYDSVALECDLEFGGTDQTFNLLAGRKLMEHFGQEPQSAMATKLLVGSDGRPMGKSLMNFIPLQSSAEDMYGKIMSVVDEVIWDYFELLTRVPMDEVEEMKKAVNKGDNPMKYKKMLAKDIVSFYHGVVAADTAEAFFEKTVQSGEVSEEDLTEIDFPENSTALEIAKIMGESSNSQAKRIIEQGGFSVNEAKVTDPFAKIGTKSGDIIKLGKRNYAKIK